MWQLFYCLRPGNSSLSKAAFQQPHKAVLFYVTDDTEINAPIEELIRDSGLDPLRIGSFDQSIHIEVFGDLHEFGSLGKPVIFTEAKQAAQSVVTLIN